MNPPPNLDRERAGWASQPAVLAFIRQVLDHRDLRGRFPKTFTYRAGDPELRVLDAFLPKSALRTKSSGRIVVQLVKVESELQLEARDHGLPAEPLEALFDRIAGRRPRNMKREANEQHCAAVDALEQGFADGIERSRHSHKTGDEQDDSEALREFEHQLAAARAGRGRWIMLAREGGFADVRRAALRLAHAVLLVRRPRRALLRLDHLSIQIAGDTKTLRPGSADYARLTETLAAIDPDQARALLPEAGGSKAMLKRLLLEDHGIVTNETPVDVLVRGPLTIHLDGERFEDIARLAQKGVATKMGLALIRCADRLTSRAGRVLTVENETAFHLLADRHADDLVIFTQGQPSLAVTRVLQRLARENHNLIYAHSGDLDRSGFLIYRTLRRRTGLDILPHQMDIQTFEAHRHLSRRMKGEEPALTQKLADEWEEPHGRQTLQHLADAGRWLEQEVLLIP